MTDSNTSGDLLSNMVSQMRTVANKAELPEVTYSHMVALTLAGCRKLLENEYLSQEKEPGTFQVKSGPFKGLRMRNDVHAGALLPMLFGCYETELHVPVVTLIKRGYGTFVNIGCGDGYYALGMALRMPNTKIIAADVNPHAQVGLRKNAVLNNVAERVDVRGLFRGEDFAVLPAGDTLVMVDIEGAEEMLLDPAAYPALKKLDVVVELHEVIKEGLAELIMARFRATHDITYIQHAPKPQILSELRPMLNDGRRYVTEFEDFIAAYEGRGGPTPWAVMTVKA